MNIFEAAIDGNLDQIEELIKNGVDVNDIDDRDEYKRTALHFASSYGELETVQYLVGNGADVNSRDYKGRTPLYTASYFGNLEIVEYLESKGAE
tara:strand:+ start:376 stop:657 length:282 start_codon:yes stop_codon:yes gene_type:complete